jgi:ABC-type branched-subunit amino acid transport system substrate-binding protein
MRRRSSWGVLAALFLPLIGCAPQVASGPGVFARPGVAPPFAPGVAEPPRARVGLLLPLSGGNAPLGQSMLNAATLALFDGGDPRVELLPRDTRGTPAGAVAAARAALAEGAVAMAGPLTLGETSAVAGVARGTPVFAFTADEAQAGPGVWVLGVTPTQQARRMVAAAAQAGARRFALLAPEDAFGQRLAAGMRSAASDLGLAPPLIQFFAARGGDVAAAVGALAGAQPDAVLIGGGGAVARQAAPLILDSFSGRPPRLLGTVLWASETGLGNEPALADAWFPGPDPEGRARFDGSFAAAFGARPPRLAGTAYDGAALAARTAREGRPPVGEAFLGADGPIRADNNGAVGRGLAVYALRPGSEPVVVQPAALPGAPGA